MKFESVKDISGKYLFQNYGRADLVFERGENCYLYDSEGDKYLDTVAGIAVNCLGYAHPAWVNVMTDQITKLVHVSNLFYVEQQAMLAERLEAITPDYLTRTLFCNSGAEANEGALKTAVRYTRKHKIASALNGFHGRTAAALGATGQTKYQESFEPLISDAFSYFEFNDLESVKETVDRDTAALLVECIQGEGGVVPATAEFMKGVRDICTDNGTLMIVDEVQTGIGRTGKWWGFEHYDIEPDIVTSAKGLGGGLPIGAVIANEDVAAVMTPGTHGTTFGGNPLVCASGCCVIDTITKNNLLDNVNEVSEAWVNDLADLESEKIADIRGKGFLLGVEMDSEETASKVKKYLFDNRILANVAHGKTVRLIPPLIFSMEQKDAFMEVFAEAVESVRNG